MGFFLFFTSPSMKQTVCHEIPLFGSKSSRWFITNWVDAEKSAFFKRKRHCIFPYLLFSFYLEPG